DLDGKTPAHIANYKPFIDNIANNTKAFGKPVLVINGDSHMYRSDDPLVQNSPCQIETGLPDTSTTACPADAYANPAANGGYYTVPNFHRIVVHGGTTYPAQPLEYLRLTISARNLPTSSDTFGPFRWERVQP